MHTYKKLHTYPFLTLRHVVLKQSSNDKRSQRSKFSIVLSWMKYSNNISNLFYYEYYKYFTNLVIDRVYYR